MTAPLYDPIAIARQFLFVRESQSLGQNRGARVEAIQHWALGTAGDSWCGEFVSLVFDIAYQGDSPIGRQQSCQQLREFCAQRGMEIPEPERGCLVLSINAAGLAHHVGICTIDDPLVTIAGNTDADGTSSNGDRVAEHRTNPANKVYMRVLS